MILFRRWTIDGDPFQRVAMRVLDWQMSKAATVRLTGTYETVMMDIFTCRTCVTVWKNKKDDHISRRQYLYSIPWTPRARREERAIQLHYNTSRERRQEGEHTVGWPQSTHATRYTVQYSTRARRHQGAHGTVLCTTKYHAYCTVYTIIVRYHTVRLETRTILNSFDTLNKLP